MGYWDGVWDKSEGGLRMMGLVGWDELGGRVASSKGFDS